MNTNTPGAADARTVLIEALDRYLRQDETAGDIDNGVYRGGLAAMSAALSTPASVAGAPSGWVPLRIEYEPGYPEDVAFGPQVMMDRLKKWLDKYFAMVAAPSAAAPTGLSRDTIQKKAIEHGFEYWRASDAHGVTGTKPQAIELLQDLIGVEVEIEDNGCLTCDGTGMIGGPSFYDPGEGGVPCPDCAAVTAAPSAATGAIDAREQGAVAWAAVHFGGKRAGKIYSTCDTREQVDAYIQQVHQSNDSVTLTARPLVFADAAPEAPFVSHKCGDLSDNAACASRSSDEAPAPSAASAQHADDHAVDRFAAEMKLKLAQARDKGRDGWETCPPADLSRMLREHVEKGDPRDVANFAMFLWSLGAPIATPATQQAVLVDAPGAVDEDARKLYTSFTDNHPSIHSNRFAPWSDLGEAEKNTWRRKSSAMLKAAPGVPK